MSDYDPQAGRDMPADPGESSAQGNADEEDLQTGLTGLAGMVAGSLGLDTSLKQVAAFATHAIPGVDGAGVSLLRSEPGSPAIQSWAATVAFVDEIDRIQYEVLNEGPCVTSIRTGRPAVSGSLGSDVRWARFGGRVARLGVHSALSLPLLVGEEVIGAINSYAHERDAFTEHAVALGEQFARPAAIAVRNAQLLVAARTKAEQLQIALTTRAVIDQAIGIIRSRSGGSPDEAFLRLRQISQSENVKLSVVAERVVDEAVRRAHARHSHS